MNHEFVADYLRRGYGVCRIQQGDKRPIYKDWNLKSLTERDFEENDNIGILTGRLIHVPRVSVSFG